MDGYIVIGTELDSKKFEAQISRLEDELDTLEQEYSGALQSGEFPEDELKKYASEIERTKNKIITLRKKQLDLEKADFSKVQASLSGIGKSIQNIIGKVSKWALAIFGIRTAYNAIRGSIATLSQYNEQLKTDIDYISYSLASALQPVVERIINLVFVLLRTINSISVAWFGINLFANATADSMNKGVKSAEKMKKALAGFDEMNVLQDTSTSGAGGGANLSPSVDLSQVDEKTVEKTKNFWKDIFKFWEEDWEYFFTNVEGNWGSFIEGIGLTGKGFYDTFKGIFTLIAGLFKVLVGIFLGDLDLMKQGWSQMGKGLVDILVGAMEIISGVLLTVLGFIKGIFLDLVNGVWYIINNVIIEGVKTIGTMAGNVIASVFKAVVNAVLYSIENILNTPIRHINSLVGVINKIPGINLSTLGTFKLPRLAVGGIVNMPGRGINYGGANIGENGAEGVIPLTNSQSLDMIADAIGKRITINANITNTMNGRVISRELQKINTNNNFATNR